MRTTNILLTIILLLLLYMNFNSTIIPNAEATYGSTKVDIVAVGGLSVSRGDLCK